ncbi:MAG: glycosyltransferase family 2 protein [Verrucomicrobiota bacterium]
MKCSVVIPFYNEVENVNNVLEEVRGVMPEAEILAVDDGSSDGTAEAIRSVDGVRYLANEKNLGQSAALYRGLLAATGEVCIMMDGDGQNDPADIPRLLKLMRDYDVVCGYRKNRQDNFQRRLASRIANIIRSSFLNDGIRDTGCSLKAMKKEHVRFLVPFNGLHRFLPALLGNAGLTIKEEPVNHRPRLMGESKYTIGGRALRGVRDLFGVSWLMARQIRWSRNPFNLSEND